MCSWYVALMYHMLATRTWEVVVVDPQSWNFLENYPFSNTLKNHSMKFWLALSLDCNVYGTVLTGLALAEHAHALLPMCWEACCDNADISGADTKACAGLPVPNPSRASNDEGEGGTRVMKGKLGQGKGCKLQLLYPSCALISSHESAQTCASNFARCTPE